MPASRHQDHTALPSAFSNLRQRRYPRPSHPAPNVRDDRETPLLAGTGRPKLVAVICPTAQENFSAAPPSRCGTLARRANHLVIPEAAQRLSGIYLSRRPVEKMDSGPAPRGASRNDDSDTHRSLTLTMIHPPHTAWGRDKKSQSLSGELSHPFGGISGCAISLNAGSASQRAAWAESPG